MENHGQNQKLQRYTGYQRELNKKFPSPLRGNRVTEMPRHVSLGWGVRKEKGGLWTRNAVRGKSVRGERRKRDGRIEWRKWDGRRSKVAAMLMRSKVDPSTLIPNPGSLLCIWVLPVDPL